MTLKSSLVIFQALTPLQPQWPQQPPTEKVLKFKIVFCDYNPDSIFSKHQNKAEIQNLDDSDVLISDFPGIKPLQPQQPHRPLQPQ